MTDEALAGFYDALADDDPVELYERAPCGYLSTTPDGTIIKVNQTFVTLTGYRREDLVGTRTFSSLLTAGGRIYHETHYAPMLQMQGAAREIAIDLVRADGTRLPALVNSVLERDGYGAAVVVRTAVFDATERRRYERELVVAKQRAEASEARATDLARTLQQTLIPPAPPEVPGLDVAAAYRPSGDGHEVGGDFYDVFQVTDGDWVAVVGDVRGKGVDAAVITALARYTIRAAAVRCESPSAILLTLNDVLRSESSDRFCTVVAVRLRQCGAGWKATLANGGHPLALHKQAHGPTAPAGRTGTLLGVFASPPVHDVDISLDPGDALVLYTDGVTEAKRADGTFFGDERVLDCVARHETQGSATTLTDRLLGAVLAFQDGDPRDDIVVVALQVPATDGATTADD